MIGQVMIDTQILVSQNAPVVQLPIYPGYLANGDYLRDAARAQRHRASSIAKHSICSRISVEWKLANTLATIMIAAAALAIGILYGQSSEVQIQWNLKLTMWRDCVDLLVSLVVCRVEMISNTRYLLPEMPRSFLSEVSALV